MKFKTILLGLSFLIYLVGNVQATRLVNAHIINEHYKAMPYVKIYDSNSVLLGETDFEGMVIFTVPIGVHSLRIAYAGYMTTVINIPLDCVNLDLILLFNVLYDFTPAWKIRCKENRRIKKLPKLHKEAYKRGLFKTKKAHYTQSITMQRVRNIEV